MRQQRSGPYRLFDLTEAELRVLVPIVGSGEQGFPRAMIQEEAKASRATTARVIDSIVSRGLVDLERLEEGTLALNEAHPIVPSLLNELYLAFGVVWGSRDHSGHRPAPRASRFEIRDAMLPRHMPAELLGGYGRPEPTTDDGSVGPSLLEMRATVRRLEQLAQSMPPLEYLASTAYETWKNERDRDFIHQTLHMGTGIHQAIAVLRSSSGPSVQRGEHPADVPGSALAWIHSTYALRAEAAMLGSFVRWLRAMEERAVLREQLVTRILREADPLVVEPNSPEEDRRRLEQLENEMTGDHGLGGLSGVQDVGRGGERLLAVLAAEMYERVLQELAPMMSAHCVADWQAARAALALEFPVPAPQILG